MQVSYTRQWTVFFRNSEIKYFRNSSMPKKFGLVQNSTVHHFKHVLYLLTLLFGLVFINANLTLAISMRSKNIHSEFRMKYEFLQSNVLLSMLLPPWKKILNAINSIMERPNIYCLMTLRDIYTIIFAWIPLVQPQAVGTSRLDILSGILTSCKSMINDIRKNANFSSFSQINDCKSDGLT